MSHELVTAQGCLWCCGMFYFVRLCLQGIHRDDPRGTLLVFSSFSSFYFPNWIRNFCTDEQEMT